MAVDIFLKSGDKIEIVGDLAAADILKNINCDLIFFGENGKDGFVRCSEIAAVVDRRTIK